MILIYNSRPICEYLFLVQFIVSSFNDNSRCLIKYTNSILFAVVNDKSKNV